MGSFYADTPGADLTRDSALVLVFLRLGEGDYQLLPNVRFVGCDRPEGAHPGSCRLRYEFGWLTTDAGDPHSPEDCWDLDASSWGQHVVGNDARFQVRRYWDGADPWTGGVEYDLLFDGFASFPQVNMDPDVTSVMIEGFGTPVRLWDYPLAGPVMRDAHTPEEAGSPRGPFLGPRLRFNPDGLGNCTTDGHDENEGERDAHPLVIDPHGDKDKRQKWTLGPTVRYLLWTANQDEEYVTNPHADDVDYLLESWEPVDSDTGYIDPDDPSTYTVAPIETPDGIYDGKALPVALAELLEPHGFTFRFELSVDGESGEPKWEIVFWRRDRKTPLKDLYMQSPEDGFQVVWYDPSATNVNAVTLQREASAANAYVAQTAPNVYEAAFVLAPLFKVKDTDADADSLKKWELTQPDGTEPVDTYRLYGYDETGDGHLDNSLEWVGPAEDGSGQGTPTPLDEVLGKPEDSASESETGEDAPKYVVRRRPPKGELVTRDSKNVPFKAELYVSVDYEGEMPAVWDGSGKWAPVQRGWELCRDRLGIRVTDKNPESWQIGTPPTPVDDPTVDGGTLRAVSCLAKPADDMACKKFILMLVCAIEGDDGIGRKAVARKRDASPAKFEVVKVDDCRDRFVKMVIKTSSPYNDAGDDIDYIDDTDRAKAHAEQRRRATELPVVRGTVTIPRLTTAYRVGDKIRGIVGRDISFRENAGTGTGEGDQYPAVESVQFHNEGDQSTVLVLGDKRDIPPKPPRLTRKRKRNEQPAGI